MSFGRVVGQSWEDNRLLSVLIELTYKCNLSCWFCYNDVALEGQPLSLDEHLRVLDELADMGVFHLVLSGGEPLAHPDFFAIGAKARERGFVVRLKTNGHRLDRATARRLVEEVDPFLLEISLHGACAETHEQQTRVRGSFDRLIANLRVARDEGLRIQLNSTLTRWNEDEMPAMMELADSLGMGLRVDPVVTVRDDGDQSPLSISASSEGLARLFLLQRERARAATAGKPALEVGRDADRALPGDPGGVERTKHCGAGSGALAIDPYGNVYPCVQWRVPLGNVRDGSIETLWHESPALAEVRQQNQAARTAVGELGELGQALGFCPGAAALETGSPTTVYPSAQRRAEITRRLASEHADRPAPSAVPAAAQSETPRVLLPVVS